MNTKTDGISSGLVAVAYIEHHKAGDNLNWERVDHAYATASPLVRLSDAEAIIAQKDAEIRQWRVLAHQEHGYVLAENRKQSERIKELESDVDEEAHIRDRMAKLLAETAVALKGPEKALHRHGWQDLPDVAAKQSAALKLARVALGEVQDLIDDSHGVYGLHLNGDESPWSEVEQGGRFGRLTTLPEALAAIDALGESNG